MNKQLKRKQIIIISPMWPSAEVPQFGSFVKRITDGLVSNGWDVSDKYLIVKPARNKIQFIKNNIIFGFDILKLLICKRAVLYVHGLSWFCGLILVINAFRRMPIIVHLHGGETIHEKFTHKISWIVIKHLIIKSSIVVVPSQYFREVVEKHIPQVSEKLCVSPSGGVDTEVFFEKEKDKRLLEKLNIDDNTYIFGFVGRIEDKKGWRTFILSFIEVLKIHPNARGIIIGFGSQSSSMLELIDHHNIKDRISIVYSLEHSDLAEHYRIMDTFVFPTYYYESLGLVPLEAMACGVKVVASNIGAIPSYVIDGETGYLCEVGSVPEISSAMIKMMSQSQLDNINMKKLCIEMASKYTAKKVNRSMSEHFETIIDLEEDK